MRLPDRAQVSPKRRESLTRLLSQTAADPPSDLASLVRNDLRVDLSARYGGLPLPHPFGKASGQLSTTLPQVEADVAAGIAFVVLKTVVAEDEAGERSMRAWTVRETRMKVEKRNGWTVTWKGRGWHGTVAEYLDFYASSLVSARGSGVPIVPSVKYHLPLSDQPFREEEYRHTTRLLLDVWKRVGSGGAMLLEKDFSPTLAGDDRASQGETIIRWLSQVPQLIEQVAPGASRVGLKLMNALFDDAFQVAMVRAAAQAHPAFLVAFNRLFDPVKRVAYGGFDLSDRNLRVLDAVRALDLPPLCATGNICSGRMMAEYALRGAESGQLHTFFQLPLSEYMATGGSRTARALHTLMLHPEDGLVLWLWHLNEAGVLPERESAVRFLDLVDGSGP